MRRRGGAALPLLPTSVVVFLLSLVLLADIVAASDRVLDSIQRKLNSLNRRLGSQQIVNGRIKRIRCIEEYVLVDAQGNPIEGTAEPVNPVDKTFAAPTVLTSTSTFETPIKRHKSIRRKKKKSKAARILEEETTLADKIESFEAPVATAFPPSTTTPTPTWDSGYDSPSTSWETKSFGTTQAPMELLHKPLLAPANNHHEDEEEDEGFEDPVISPSIDRGDHEFGDAFHERRYAPRHQEAFEEPPLPRGRGRRPVYDDEYDEEYEYYEDRDRSFYRQHPFRPRFRRPLRGFVVPRERLYQQSPYSSSFPQEHHAAAFASPISSSLGLSSSRPFGVASPLARVAPPQGPPPAQIPAYQAAAQPVYQQPYQQLPQSPSPPPQIATPAPFLQQLPTLGGLSQATYAHSAQGIVVPPIPPAAVQQNYMRPTKLSHQGEGYPPPPQLVSPNRPAPIPGGVPMGFGDGATPENCQKMARLAKQFGIPDFTEFARNNCAFLQTFAPKVTCEQISAFASSCKSIV